MRVSLPMYNLPEMRAENAAFWQALREELARRGVTGLPDTPDFTRPPVPGAIEPDTLFTQVCG
ncbi:MAG: phosphate ABC transporter substrate-binding protein, partial [Acetobacteraceae bacterium]